MAITITPQILGQTATATCSYCYLYEPFRIFAEESNILATKLYIDIELISTDTEVVIETLTDYVEKDLAPNVGITIDLMKVVRQINDSNIWKYSSVNQLASTTGYLSVLANYRFRFNIRTDITTAPVSVYKMPIIGIRNMEQMSDVAVAESSPMNEFQYYGLDEAELKTRWSGISFITTELLNPDSSLSIKPTITENITVGTPPCGGFIIWKSRFGGWAWWGFDIKTESKSKKYNGSLEVDLYESTEDKNGDIFMPVDYTSITTMYTRTLKALSLTDLELKAVSEIHASPAVYYRHTDGRIELMRLTSSEAPISNLISGGDFSVTLKSISKGTQSTI